MHALTRRNALILAVALSAIMWLTRGNHFASPVHLPDASWAIFFLAGFYFRQRAVLALFLVQAALVDCLVTTQFGVSNYCVTPAYIFLLPAYSALWLTGHWFAAHYRLNMRSLPYFAAAALAGTAACELVSSGSFYFLGGRFAETSLGEFATRLVEYFPADLGGAALYLGCATAIHLLISSIRPAHPAAQ
jgi:hypothetical protein